MTSAPSGHGDAFAGDATLEVVALGGLREFGMNLMAISFGETCLVVDAGVSFPDVELLGIPGVTFSGTIQVLYNESPDAQFDGDVPGAPSTTTPYLKVVATDVTIAVGPVAFTGTFSFEQDGTTLTIRLGADATDDTARAANSQPTTSTAIPRSAPRNGR